MKVNKKEENKIVNATDEFGKKQQMGALLESSSGNNTVLTKDDRVELENLRHKHAIQESIINGVFTLVGATAMVVCTFKNTGNMIRMI